jgi:hypothetical protein
LPAPIVGMAATPDGKGYRLFGAGGAVYAFGDAVPSTPAPAPTPPSAKPTTGPVVTTPVTTPVPNPRARRALKVKLALSWTWNRSVTRLSRAEIGRFPARTSLRISCRGRGCPRHSRDVAVGRRRLLHLLRALAGRRYRAGDRLFITFSAPGRRPERAEVIIRNGKLPRVRLLRS